MASLEAALRPCKRHEALRALTRLRLMTAAPRDGAGDAEARLAAYVDALAAYPIDIVEETCDAWGRAERWWPAWADLKAELDLRIGWRQQALRALGRIEAESRSS